MAMVWTIVHKERNEKAHDLELFSTQFLAAAIAARRLFEKSKLDSEFQVPEFLRASIKRATK
jgi:hypothetical protein